MLPDRFWAKVDQSDECWLWTACTDRDGYGAFVLDGRRQFAHRLAYAALVGPIPDGLQVDHRCHQRGCVRPEHLHLVTSQKNHENRSGATRTNVSGVRGVSWHSSKKRWCVKVGHQGRKYHGGQFVDLHEAEQAAVALRMRLMTNNLADRSAA